MHYKRQRSGILMQNINNVEEDSAIVRECRLARTHRTSYMQKLYICLFYYYLNGQRGIGMHAYCYLDHIEKGTRRVARIHSTRILAIQTLLEISTDKVVRSLVVINDQK